MSFFRQLSLRTQMLAVVACIVLAGFALTLSILTWQAGQMQREAALRYASELAAHSARNAAVPLQQGLEAARTLAATLGALKTSGNANRQAGHAILRTVLEQNPRFVGVWTGWEPNAFDERDSDFADMAGHDATGRYVPYWNRGGANGSTALDPLTDYEKPGAGDYYQLPKSTGKATLLEPYAYQIGGKSVLITTLSVPIVIEGRFVGVAGVDITLDGIQDIVQAIRIYENGYASLLSNQSIYVAAKDRSKIGKPADTSDGLSNDQLQTLRTAVRGGQSVELSVKDPLIGGAAVRIQVPLQLDGVPSAWSFSATVPSDEILAQVRRLQWSAVALGLLSIALVSVVLAFAVYAFFSGGPGNLQWLYPNELFPTDIRASAVGVIMSLSRIGTIVSTWALPVFITKYGISNVMLMGAGISLIGLLVSIAFAPETRGLTLAQTSQMTIRSKPVTRAGY